MEPKINVGKITSDDRSDSGWERETIVNLAQAGLKEQRRARRWGIFFKLLGFAYVTLFLFSLIAPQLANISPTSKHTALVELAGVIADGEEASADNVVSGLRAAFESDQSAAVILRINSPGGSPVQASYINREIKRLRELHQDKPIYAVVTDICASGGVFAAVAADKIYADKASIVGSIGVRMDGFGFVDAIEKLGVERRLMTAGDHKGLLDPFQPENEFEKKHIQTLLDEIHQQFIDVVVDGRGDKLAKDKNMFSGLFWTGEQALELGLVDGFGSASYVAREVVGVEEMKDYTFRDDVFQRFAKQLGAAIVDPITKVFEYPVLR